MGYILDMMDKLIDSIKDGSVDYNSIVLGAVQQTAFIAAMEKTPVVVTKNGEQVQPSGVYRGMALVFADTKNCLYLGIQWRNI